MDPRSPEPIGFSEQKHVSKKHSLAGDGAVEGEQNEQVVQRPEDNPRALSPSSIKPSFAGETVTIPIVDVSEVPVIPPTFSASSWARRNARVQKAKRVLPDGFRIFMAYALILIYAVWCVVVVAVAACGPGVLAMVIGNAICQAAGLPYHRRMLLAIETGAIGGFFASLAAFSVSFVWGGLCSSVDEHFRERCIRAGRIASNSTRKNGHFPVVLMWIPFVYIDCLLAGTIGFGFRSEAGFLLRREVMQMVAIGSIFVAIFCVLIPPAIVGLLQVVYQTLKEIAYGFPEKDDPSILPYLHRQAEAFMWLLTPRKKNSPSETVPTKV